jgi:hypothetical protein
MEKRLPFDAVCAPEIAPKLNIFPAVKKRKKRITPPSGESSPHGENK